MTTKQYKTVTTVCTAIAVIATLIFDRFEGSKVIASILAGAATSVALGVYLYASEDDNENRPTEVLERPAKSDTPSLFVMSDEKDDSVQNAFVLMFRDPFMSKGVVQSGLTTTFAQTSASPMNAAIQLVRDLALMSSAECELTVTSEKIIVRIVSAGKFEEPEAEFYNNTFDKQTRGKILLHPTARRAAM